MGKIVVVAEKPSVGRDIARVLGCRGNGDGCMIGDQYIVTWAVGHLVTLMEPDELDEKYKKWTFATLPILVVYPFVQRYFVAGVTIGAVKG